MSLPDIDFSRVGVVTFDAGGTLLKPTPSVGEIYAEIVGQHGVEYEPELLNQRFRSAFKEMTAKRPRPEVNEATEYLFWREVVQRCLGPDCPERFVDEVFGELWEEFAEASRWEILPGVEETLAELGARRKVFFAVLSNWDSRLHRVLEGLGLKKHFDRVFISSEIGCEKPDVRAFRAVEKEFKVPPEMCLHLGDHYAHDYTAAHDAGWQALLVSPTPPTSDPDANRIATFSELPAILG